MPDTLPMKILTVVSVAIVVVDVEVLRKTFTEYFQLKQVLENEPYQQCYKPQAQLRIVFQCYAIYAALVCTTLTSMLAFSCSDQFVEAVARLIINLCFLVFGPILLTFVNYGFVHFKQLSFVCTPRGASHHINFIDIVLILASFVLALCVTFTMAMQKTLDMAQQSFQDENSLIYRLTSMYFSYQVRQSQERDRQQLRQRAEERREQRRQRQAERAQVLTAFQSQHPEVTAGGNGGQATCPNNQGGQLAVSSQASTIALNAPQRTLVDSTPAMRANRDLGNIPSSLGAGGIHTLASLDDEPRNILDEDYDEEMNTFRGIQQRATNYEYAQMQEEKQLREFMSNMPEAQIISGCRTLNQQLAAGEAAKRPSKEPQPGRQNAFDSELRQMGAGSFRMQANALDSVRNANIGQNLCMAQETSANHQQDTGRPVEEEVEVGEQLIKDTKTVSGASQSQASTNLQTYQGSNMSSGAAAVSSSFNHQQVQGAAVGAVPPSNYGSLSVLNEESHSEIAFQSNDGAVAQGDQAEFENQSSRSYSSKNGRKQKEKKE